jgi:exodeoxyribonuclease-3
MLARILLSNFFSLLLIMKIISANLNGIRSAAKKNFFEWMHKQQADFVCVQELKAQYPDMSPDFLAPAGYHGHFHYAEKKDIQVPVFIRAKNPYR